jgi:glc operon protein GlcG
MTALTLALARSVADAVVASAVGHGVVISVVVVDGRGEQVVAMRMDGAPGFTQTAGLAKARSAVHLRSDSGDLVGLKSDYPELIDLIGDHAGFRITTLPGALVVLRGEEVLGAVAVSGAHPDVDVACARSGVDVWLA